MKTIQIITGCFLLTLSLGAAGQDGADAGQDGAPEAAAAEMRYSVAVIDDATFYAHLSVPAPLVLNQILLEPTFSIHYDKRYSFSASLIGNTTTYADNVTQLHVRETYAGVSAGDFDLSAGRKLVRWGTGYAFTAAGVLDPPRVPTDPSDRLNLNVGRDMIKADVVRGSQALTLAWSTATLAPAASNLHDTTALRYNVLFHSFDTALIAGNDRGGDSFGALTFTRVLGLAWEIHGEAAWREHEAILMGAKYTAPGGITFIGEFFTPPNTPYYRDAAVSALAGRQHYAFLNAGKTRLRDRPGWKEWDLSGSIVGNLNDHSYTGVFDVNRWFGKHTSTYAHIEVPGGAKSSEQGAMSYSYSTALGMRFQL